MGIQCGFYSDSFFQGWKWHTALRIICTGLGMMQITQLHHPLPVLHWLCFETHVAIFSSFPAYPVLLYTWMERRHLNNNIPFLNQVKKSFNLPYSSRSMCLAIHKTVKEDLAQTEGNSFSCKRTNYTLFLHNKGKMLQIPRLQQIN